MPGFDGTGPGGTDPARDGAGTPAAEVWLSGEELAEVSAEAGALVRDFMGIISNPSH